MLRLAGRTRGIWKPVIRRGRHVPWANLPPPGAANRLWDGVDAVDSKSCTSCTFRTFSVTFHLSAPYQAGEYQYMFCVPHRGEGLHLLQRSHDARLVALVCPTEDDFMLGIPRLSKV